ncbi:hypothetical protein F2P79_024292 [Pimephales promelas]|nr:hypothetical protein F2P79_024292 [Pimephales promelas]
MLSGLGQFIVQPSRAINLATSAAVGLRSVNLLSVEEGPITVLCVDKDREIMEYSERTKRRKISAKVEEHLRLLENESMIDDLVAHESECPLDDLLEHTENLQLLPVEELKTKMVLLPHKTGYVALPLLH